MRTDDLITALAADLTPVDPASTERRSLGKLMAGALVAFAVVLLWLGPRPDIAAAAALPMFWLKLAFPASLGVAALVALRRLGYPGVRLGRAPLGVAAPVALVWLMAAVALLIAAPAQRLPLVLGETWQECPVTIALLSVPVMVFAFWALRGLAPTRLPLAGAAAGLFAGAAAALAYALHCPEMEAPFLGVWYVLGMLIPTGIGALLGPCLLKW
ncbi:MAG: DUF1109 domain-containing protein [Ramlibacter sp.]|nr:DUF1109 domain-containing protein [Ramlibacter sp.]